MVKFAIHGPGVLNIEKNVSVPVTELSLGKPPNLPQSYKDALMMMVTSQFPDLKLHSHRLCWYADTTTGDFLICKHPALRNLVLATGGSGHGFKFAPCLGEIVADVVEGKEWSRFGWRDNQLLVDGKLRSKGDGMRTFQLGHEVYKQN